MKLNKVQTPTSLLMCAVVASLASPAPSRAQSASVPTRAELAAKTKVEFLHAWNGYRKHAWGFDELLPVSKAGKNWHGGNSLLMTPVDTLDTLILLGLTKEADETREYIARNLRLDQDIVVKNFEITIRILGGLLSGYQMTGDKRLLALAEDLGNRLLPVFESPTGLPYMYVNLKTGKVSEPVTNPAEIGTLILEFGTLARLTGRDVFFAKAKRALVELYKRRDPTTGLVGSSINVETGAWVSKNSHVGGAIDSYYEYLLKCERLFDDAECGAMAKDALASVNKHLADEVEGALWYGGADMTTGARTRTTYGSLHAFLPSVFVLAGDLDRARRLQDSGFRMWNLHGIEPEVLDYKEMRATRAGYELRPEIMESAYYLDRATKDPKYVEMGRVFLDGLMKHCRTDAGYTTLKDVTTKEKNDLMHSFFLAETMKYLYLLFEPKALDFDAVVFNTEAHPLKKVPAKSPTR